MKVFIKDKEVDLGSIVIDGIDIRDYPDFCDSYISSCEFVDGTELSDDEMNKLKEMLSDDWNEMVINQLY